MITIPKSQIYVENDIFLGRVEEQDRFRDALRILRRESILVMRSAPKPSSSTSAFAESGKVEPG